MIPYSKLAEATSSCKQNEHVYAIDITECGKKRYVVGSDVEFRSWYLQLERKNVHEVLLSNKPCHLFFDIEYLRADYDVSDEHSIIDNVLTLVRMCIPRRLFILSNIVLLCASDDKKMSWHIVFHGVIFNNIDEMGMFVRFIVMKYGRQHIAALFYGLSGCVVDLRVYGNNRTFRIWGSTKMGSRRTLLRFMRNNTYINADNVDTNVVDTLIMCRHVDDSKLMKLPKSCSSQRLRRIDLPEKYRGIVTWMQERFPNKKIYSAKLCGNVISAALMSRTCIISNTTHKSNHVTINVNMNTCQWYMGCFKCRGKSPMRKIRDNVVIQLCKK